VLLPKSSAQVVNELPIGQFINGNKEKTMLWTIVVVLFILWLLGFSFSIGGSLIHLLLVVALIILVINLVSGRRAI
jgi:hypothetical protein